MAKQLAERRAKRQKRARRARKRERARKQEASKALDHSLSGETVSVKAHGTSPSQESVRAGLVVPTWSLDDAGEEDYWEAEEDWTDWEYVEEGPPVACLGKLLDEEGGT
jgi:hypothetical protein